ncbi:hypothetical protein TM7_0628 [candidate division TM7 genomosp. GTL1]|nr:hypothetical protein TM7_0628 [candidate division TM7 genomosp. GTL1]
MAKTKKKLTSTYSIVCLGVVLTIGVIVSGTHLNDVLASIFQFASPSPLAVTDASKKATGDLHNHIEKQTLKSVVKLVGDDIARTDRRHVKHKIHPKKPLSLRHFGVPEFLFGKL